MKDFLPCLFWKLICIKDQRQFMFACFFLKLKLDAKEGTANERELTFSYKNID